MFKNFNKIKKFTGKIVSFGDKNNVDNYITTLILDNEITSDLVYFSGLFINGIYYDSLIDEINYYGSTIEIKPIHNRFIVTDKDIIYILYKSTEFENIMKYNELKIIEEKINSTNVIYTGGKDEYNNNIYLGQVTINHNEYIYNKKTLLGVIFNGVIYLPNEYSYSDSKMVVGPITNYISIFTFNTIRNFSYSTLDSTYIYDSNTDDVKEEKIPLSNSFKSIYLSPKAGVENVY